MNEKEKEKPKFGWLERLKRVKHIEIYIAVIFIAIIALIYLSTVKESSTDSTDSAYEMTITGYVEYLETELESILSNIGGVSNVNVMITLDMSEVKVDNSTITIENFPAIKGIIITASGVSDTALKLKVLYAVEAVIDVTRDNIQILSSD